MKQALSVDDKKGLKQVAVASATYFLTYIPTSLWWSTQQEPGSFYNKSNQNKKPEQ